MKNGLLKKLTAISLAAVMIFTATACNNNDDDGKDSSKSTTKTTTTTTKETESDNEDPTTESTEDAGESDVPESEGTESEAPSEDESEKPEVPEDYVGDFPADRYDATTEPRTGANETTPLVMQSGEFSGRFSPFFATSVYDSDVADLTQIALLSTTKDGEPIANVDEPSFAYSYNIETADDGSESVYHFVLKNGITFSDGEPVTVKDVLFSMAVFSDFYFDGNSTFYSMNIPGLEEYRYQTSTEQLEKVEAILAAGINPGEELTFDEAEAPATTEDQEAFWAYWDKAGADFAQSIVDYVTTNYASDVPSIFGEGTELSDLTDGQKVMFGMAMWGFGEIDGETFTTASGKEFSLDDEVTAEDYFAELMAEYGYNLDPDEGINYESAGKDLEEFIKDYYMANEGAVEGGVNEIYGITTGTEVGEDGIERETITITIDGLDPTAIFKLAVAVTPMHYYTEGWSGEELNDYGVVPQSREFFEHLKNKNVKPLGAGPYAFESFQDNIVTFTANDSYMMGSPKIKTVRYQQIAGGAEMDALKTGTVHYANPSAKTTEINAITEGQGDYAPLDYALVDNDGYGYIGIQGQAIPDFEVRQAIVHAINPELSISDFYGELASVNYRTMTKILWAYPDNPEPIYPYDGTGETSKQLFLDAGYTYDEAENVMYYPEDYADEQKAGQPVKFTFTLPNESDQHPAGVIFLDTQKVLGSIGVEVEIEVDTALLDKLSTAYESRIEVWTAAWGGGGVDPDMFQIWYSDPDVNTGTSAARSGLYWLFENGSEEEKEMLTRLNELIVMGRSSLDQEERKVIYKEALELSTGIAVEVPTYQRKNMFAFNADVINTDTLFSGDDVTPFQSPLSDIWKVELNG